MDSDEVFEYWNDYGWNWKTPADVQEFVEKAIETGCYEYSLEAFNYFGGGFSGEDWYLNWWYPLHKEIERCVTKFSEDEMDEIVSILLKPFDEYSDNGDQAIYDALVEFYPQFLSKNDKYSETFETYYRNMCEFSWFPFMEEYFNWTYFGPETLAKSPELKPDNLIFLFEESFTSEHIYHAYRVRVALAMNPSTPLKVLEFLFRHKGTSDWMLHDPNADGLLVSEGNSYTFKPEFPDFEAARGNSEKVEDFSITTSDRWDSCPNANLMSHLLDIEIEIESARESLLIAFAKNSALPVQWYEELAEIELDSVRYFLSKNPSISPELKARYAIENPTFTFTSSEVWKGEPVTLN